MHERTELRNAIAAQLTTGVPSVSSRVFKTRFDPMRLGELPALAVYTLEEDVDPATHDTAPRELKRSIDVAIDAWAKVPADGAIDDAIDALALEVETAMDADFFLSGTAYDSWLARTEVKVAVDGDYLVGCAHIVFTVEYHTDRRVPPVVDLFDEISVTWEDLDGTAPKIDVGNQATDVELNINQE